jgi:putative membrane protein
MSPGSGSPSPLPLLLAALALPWLLVGLTALPVLPILSLQLALFTGLAGLLCLPRVRVALLPAAPRRALAERTALEQFMLRGVGRTEGHTGVLVFVSLAEHYARMVADEAIAARRSGRLAGCGRRADRSLARRPHGRRLCGGD